MTILRSPTRGSFSGWLSTLPQTALVTVVGLVLMIATGCVVLPCLALHRALDGTILSIWLGAVFGMLGVGAHQFSTKRKTWRPDLTPVPPPGFEQDDPMMQSEGGSTYHVVPADQIPAYLNKQPPARRAAAAVPVVPDDSARPAYIPQQKDGSGG
jgi:hypothetical protein